MTSAFAALVRRDLALAVRAGGAGGLALAFYLAVVATVPFAVGPDAPVLARIGPSVLWVGALLSTLLGLDRLFGADAEDGSLDLLRLAPAPLEVVALAKATAHWLATGLPLALASPLYGLLLGLGPEAAAAAALSLLVGTPGLAFVGAVGAALTATVRRGGLLVAVIALPFAIPILIFGAAAADPAGPARGQAFAILGALTLAAGAIGTVAAAAALRGGE